MAVTCDGDEDGGGQRDGGCVWGKRVEWAEVEVAAVGWGLWCRSEREEEAGLRETDNGEEEWRRRGGGVEVTRNGGRGGGETGFGGMEDIHDLVCSCPQDYPVDLQKPSRKRKHVNANYKANLEHLFASSCLYQFFRVKEQPKDRGRRPRAGWSGLRRSRAQVPKGRGSCYRVNACSESSRVPGVDRNGPTSSRWFVKSDRASFSPVRKNKTPQGRIEGRRSTARRWTGVETRRGEEKCGRRRRSTAQETAGDGGARRRGNVRPWRRRAAETEGCG